MSRNGPSAAIVPVCLALIASSLAGCGEADGRADRWGYEEVAEADRDPFDEDAARDAAEEELSGQSYAEIGTPYGCTVDCAGHEAGYRYRADNGHVGFNADSPSFNEGGQAFEDAVEDRVEEMRAEYESGGDASY